MPLDEGEVEKQGDGFVLASDPSVRVLSRVFRRLFLDLTGLPPELQTFFPPNSLLVEKDALPSTAARINSAWGRMKAEGRDVLTGPVFVMASWPAPACPNALRSPAPRSCCITA